MATITMCMIVKNEEDLLKRCLESYAGTYDELIIVDTGSTDGTKEVASTYTDLIYDFTWVDDFSAARNFAFSKASCEYIYSADADEVLDEYNRQAFLDLKRVLLPEIEIVQMKYVNSEEYNTVYNFKKEYRPKLFRRLRTFTWISPIHETIRLTPVVFDSDIEIQHLPKQSHSKRDFSAFIKAIRTGIPLDDYVIIMFCKELFISGEDEDFLDVSEIFENVLTYMSCSADCQRNIRCVLAKIYRLRGEKDSFYKLCISDMETTGLPCAEMAIELALNYYDTKDYYGAIQWFDKAANQCESIIDIRCGGHLPRKYLAACYEQLKLQFQNTNDTESAAAYEQQQLLYEQEAAQWVYPEENF